VVSELLMADAMDGRGLASSESGSSTASLSMRAVCGEVEDLPLEQMTSPCRKAAMPPSSPHAGDRERAQNASPIPRSAAHKMVAANGQAARFPCDDACSLTAATAETCFELNTGQDPE
jgi:hypothetical protein